MEDNLVNNYQSLYLAFSAIWLIIALGFSFVSLRFYRLEKLVRENLRVSVKEKKLED